MIGTHKTRLQTTHATHVSKPPRSNRQNLARLEIVVTPSEQSPAPISNRQFLRPLALLPWIQLQHEAFQLQLPGHFHRTNSASASEQFPITAPAPEGRQSDQKSGHILDGSGLILITGSAIRKRLNPNKTNNRGHF
jgi:hypothetical protein